MSLLNSYLGYLIVIVIVVMSLFIKKMKTSLLKKVLKSTLILGIFFIFVMQLLVVSELYSVVPDSVEVDYLIVLGAGLKGDKVSYSLAYRLDAAAAYLEEHAYTKVIVSGGQGPDEWVSEAYAMKAYLLVANIEENRILMEDQSTSTEENIVFSKKIIRPNAQVALVTSNYHMYRAKYIASAYINDIQGISAHAPYWSQANYMIRESITILNEWRKKFI